VNTHSANFFALLLESFVSSNSPRHSFRQNLPQTSDDESFFSEEENYGQVKQAITNRVEILLGRTELSIQDMPVES
jgi:hypothetical protein